MILFIREAVIVFKGDLERGMRCAERQVEKKGMVALLLHETACPLGYGKGKVGRILHHPVVLPDGAATLSLLPLAMPVGKIVVPVLHHIPVIRGYVAAESFIEAELPLKSPVIGKKSFLMPKVPFPHNRR